MAAILGLSLGTRLVGMAIAIDGELCHYRVRTFYGAWTPEKQNCMIAAIKKTVKQYVVTALVLKTPKPAHCSRGIQDLIRGIQELAAELGIKLSVCTISGLKGRQNGQGRGNRRNLMQSIIEKYPNHRQLAQLYERERSNHSAYHVKLFEAIACTELS